MAGLSNTISDGAVRDDTGDQNFFTLKETHKSLMLKKLIINLGIVSDLSVSHQA